MAEKATFYHAGCGVCVDAEQKLAKSLDPKQFDVEIVHLGEAKNRIAEAEAAGVRSVPALGDRRTPLPHQLRSRLGRP